MPDYAYAYEKLRGAVEIMATGKGSRADRLARATHQYLLRLRKPKANGLPADLATHLAEFIEEMTAKRNLQSWDAIDKTAQMMPWQTAERMSRQLLDLFLAVSALRNNRP